MKILKTGRRWQNEYPIPAFLAKFLLIYLVIDYTFIFFIGASASGGRFDIPFIANHFNVIHWLEQFLLHSGGYFASLFGYDFTVEGKRMSLDNGTGVIMGYTCIGYGFLSFLMGFLLSFPSVKSVRVKYLLIGIPLLFILNIMRVGGLAMVYVDLQRSSIAHIDHHFWFNVAVYIIIGALLVVFVKESGRKGVWD